MVFELLFHPTTGNAKLRFSNGFIASVPF